MDEAGSIQLESLQCLQCGYSLRGLMMDGKCPECGLEIAESVRGDHLSNSDLAWLKKLHRGSLFLVLGIAGIVLTLCLSFSLLDANEYEEGDSYRLISIVTAVAIGGLVLLMLGGVILLTSREEDSYYQRKHNVIRITARVSVALTLCSFMLIYAAYLLKSINGYLILLCVSSLCVFIWSFMLYMSTLAFRAKARFLMFASKVIAWGVPGLALLSVLLGVYGMACLILAGDLFLLILLLVACIAYLEEFNTVLKKHHLWIGSDDYRSLGESI